MSISDPTLGEITMFAGNFAPRGWAFCDGQLLPIAQNTALFSLLGTMYGGDGRTTFGLPEMRGRFARHAGQGPGLPEVRQGNGSGRVSHTLSVSEMPSHNHIASLHGELATADKISPQGNMLAVTDPTNPIYAAPVPADNRTMASESIVVGNTGAGMEFDIMNPYCTVQFIIALTGTFPSRS